MRQRTNRLKVWTGPTSSLGLRLGQASAIENARLFNETKEALDQQTATAEILRVISRSQTDAQPVFDTIAQNVLRLCDATWSMVARYDGELVHIVALDAPEVAEARRRNPWIDSYPRPLARAGLIGKAILGRSLIHVPDAETDERFSPRQRQFARMGGTSAFLVVPLLREGTVVGALSVARPKPGAFTDT